ncbi:unnamed protein product [Ambrosiozyma monospora]|uniref:Unnamed protein product n=1 Tax=Ambrosiozyma monospora TaxID=43982 RepID=A0ACB5T1P1_AMBMO|nr:unnamed protein product [Ambrosiozyma monospora]
MQLFKWLKKQGTFANQGTTDLSTAGTQCNLSDPTESQTIPKNPPTTTAMNTLLKPPEIQHILTQDQLLYVATFLCRLNAIRPHEVRLRHLLTGREESLLSFRLRVLEKFKEIETEAANKLPRKKIYQLLEVLEHFNMETLKVNETRTEYLMLSFNG